MTFGRNTHSRRTVILFLGASAPFLGGFPGCLDEIQKTRHMLLSIARNAYFSSELGSLCLRSLPPELTTLDQLLTAIVERIELKHWPVDTLQELDIRIGQQVHREFSKGVIASIDGWILAEIEVHLYALRVVA